VQRLKSELGGEQAQTICIATGGMADVIANETDLIEHLEPNLVLHGLQMVWERIRHD
jgi:pantothenate kinase type III